MINYCKRIPFLRLVRLEFAYGSTFMTRGWWYECLNFLKLILPLWRWRQQVVPKRLYPSTKLHRGKDEKVFIHAMKAYRQRTCLIHPFLTSALDRDE